MPVSVVVVILADYWTRSSCPMGSECGIDWEADASVRLLLTLLRYPIVVPSGLVICRWWWVVSNDAIPGILRLRTLKLRDSRGEGEGFI